MKQYSIDLIGLLKNKTTYKTRSGYENILNTKIINQNEILVFYRVGGAILRYVSRIFPRYINVNARLIWACGFIQGEELKSINPKSSIYRFAVTNNDPQHLKRVIDILEENKLLYKINLPKNCIIINYGEKCDISNLIPYWCKNLQLNKDNIKISSKTQKQKKAKYGTATLCISDVLLRRVIDLIINKIIEDIFLNKQG